ncbi:hypothetical protein D3C76_1112140 [compost metagenome]
MAGRSQPNGDPPFAQRGQQLTNARQQIAGRQLTDQLAVAGVLPRSEVFLLRGGPGTAAFLQQNVQRFASTYAFKPFIDVPVKGDAKFVRKLLPGKVMVLRRVRNHAVQIEDYCLQPCGQGNCNFLPRRQMDKLSLVANCKSITFKQRVRHFIVPDANLQQSAAVRHFESAVFPLRRQCGRERKDAVPVQPQTAETVHDRHPGARHRGGMKAIFYVPIDVVQIHPHRAVKIFVSLLQITDLSGHDTVNAGR